jgi:type IV pilus assembly protein PilY1
MGVQTCARSKSTPGARLGCRVSAFAAVLAIQPCATAQVAQEPLLVRGSACSGATATSLSFPASTLTDGALLLQSSFTAGTWQGDVRAQDARRYLAFVRDGGEEPAPLWSANVPAAAERNLHTSTGQRNAVPFSWCSLGDAQRLTLDPAYAATPCPVAPPAIMDYLRGDPAQEVRNGGAFRDRPGSVLGDVVHSTPWYSRAADHALQLAPAASFSANGVHGHALYRSFVTWKRSSRMPTVSFGANDGIFHVLDARRGESTSGREIFAYVPRAVFPLLPSLADPLYAHRFLVDGPVIEGDVWTGTAWKTLVIGTTGAGPAGVFALDMTDPGAAMDGRHVLWDIVASDHASAAVRSALGRTIGAGVIGSVRYDPDGVQATEPNGSWAYIVGNGYESPGGTAALLVFNALDGSLIRAIDTGVGNANFPNGLGAVAPVYDGNRNIVAVYAGDRQGNLWKFDLGASNPADWRIFNEQPAGVPAPLFVASEGGMTRPIHEAPRVMPHPSGGVTIAFGTGRYFEVNDPFDTDDQGIFVLRDAGGVAPIAFGDLELIRTESYTNGVDAYRRLFRSDLANYDARDQGFWVRLRPFADVASGERVISPLAVDGGVLVATTYAPGDAPADAPDACAPAGASYVYRIDLTTGFSRAAFTGADGTTVARRGDAITTAFVPLHWPAEPAGAAVSAISAGELASMLGAAVHRLSPDDGSVQRTSAGSCLHAGARLDGSVVRIETRCAGLMPLRAWRPMK